MTKKPLVFIKLGGSLITDKTKPYTARPDILNKVVSEIYSEWAKEEYLFVVGNGAGSFGHMEAHKYETQNGFINSESKKGFALVQNQAAILNRMVVTSFLNAGVNAISVSPSSALVANHGKIDEWFIDPIEKLFNNNIMPVLYGDVVNDVGLGCSIISTDELFNYLAQALSKKYKIHSVIHMGITDGIFDKNKKTIKIISKDTIESVMRLTSGSHGIDVTGGMELKLKESFVLAQKGIESYVVNGTRLEQLKNILLKKSINGTRITYV